MFKLLNRIQIYDVQNDLFIVVSLLFFKHVVSIAAYCIFYLLLNVTHFNVFAGRHGPKTKDAATKKEFLDAYRPQTSCRVKRYDTIS
jgi:hypothetical protein